MKYPHSVIKVGVTLYLVLSSTDNGKSKTEITEWVVRSIRKKRGPQTKYNDKRFGNGDNNDYVNLIWKIDGVSWGKRSSKNGDFGWLKIPSFCRKQFRVGNDLPHGFFTTKRAALKWAEKEHVETIKWYDSEISNNPDDTDLVCERNEHISELASIKRAISRLK